MAQETIRSEQIVPRIDALMVEQGRKVGWLCKQTGIGYSAMRRRRQEPSTFTLNELEAIAAALGINTSDLIVEEQAA